MTTPWGIITSIFVHKDLKHFISNMGSLLFTTILFICINLNLNEHDKKRRSSFYFKVVFLSAILANLGWLLLQPNNVLNGSSGAAYSSFGIMFGFTLINSISGFKKDVFRKFRQNNVYVINIFTLVIIFFHIVLQPNEFIAEGTGAQLLNK